MKSRHFPDLVDHPFELARAILESKGYDVLLPGR